MLELSKFYGITIKMYYFQKEHNPPHIHAIYEGYMSAINIQTMTVIEGDLPNRILKLVIKWIKIHKDELLKIWESQEFIKIKPLE